MALQLEFSIESAAAANLTAIDGTVESFSELLPLEEASFNGIKVKGAN